MKYRIVETTKANGDKEFSPEKELDNQFGNNYWQRIWPSGVQPNSLESAKQAIEYEKLNEITETKYHYL